MWRLAIHILGQITFIFKIIYRQQKNSRYVNACCETSLELQNIIIIASISALFISGILKCIVIVNIPTDSSNVFNISAHSRGFIQFTMYFIINTRIFHALLFSTYTNNKIEVILHQYWSNIRCTIAAVKHKSYVAAKCIDIIIRDSYPFSNNTNGFVGKSLKPSPNLYIYKFYGILMLRFPLLRNNKHS